MTDIDASRDFNQTRQTMLVPCTRCGAREGERCVTAHGVRTVEYHTPRRRLYRKTYPDGPPMTFAEYLLHNERLREEYGWESYERIARERAGLL